jgi:hypothetical protein
MLTGSSAPRLIWSAVPMSPTNTSKAPPIMSQCGNSMFASPTRDECILAAKASYLEFLFFGARGTIKVN